jgi:hypothetical protein
VVLPRVPKRRRFLRVGVFVLARVRAQAEWDGYGCRRGKMQKDPGSSSTACVVVMDASDRVIDREGEEGGERTPSSTSLLLPLLPRATLAIPSEAHTHAYTQKQTHRHKPSDSNRPTHQRFAVLKGTASINQATLAPPSPSLSRETSMSARPVSPPSTRDRRRRAVTQACRLTDRPARARDKHFDAPNLEEQQTPPNRALPSLTHTRNHEPNTPQKGTDGRDFQYRETIEHS